MILKTIKYKIKKLIINFIYISDSKMRKIKRKELKKSYINKYISAIEKKYSDYYIFLPHYPIGDFTVITGLMKEFTQKHGKVVLVVNKKSYKNLCNMLKLPIKIEYFPINNNDLYPLLSELPYNFRIGKICPLLSDSFSQKDISTNIEIKNIIDLYAYLLQIDPAKYELNLPYIKTRESKNILILPYANSFDDSVCSKEFWLELAAKIEGKGFNVSFNAPKNSFGKYKCIFPSLEDIGKIAASSYAVISFRSGIADFLANIELNNLIVLYPSNMKNKNFPLEMFYEMVQNNFSYDEKLNNTENILKINSLNNLFNKNNTKEILIDKNTYELSITKIINSIKEGK